MLEVTQQFPISIGSTKVSIDPSVLDYLKGVETRKIIYAGEYNGNIFCEGSPISHNGSMSLSKNILSDEICSSIKNQIDEAINEFVRGYLRINFDGKFFINRSWVLEHRENHWSQPHSHPNSILSGVLYLDVPENSGNIRFHKPDNYHNQLNTDTINFVVHEYNIQNSDTWTIVPEDGDLLLFPSHLRHSVAVNSSGKTRWSLSFDCYVEGLLDSYDMRRLYLNRYS